MKKIEELYNEVMVSDELKKEFLEAFQSQEATEAILKKYDCDATFEDFQAFLKEKQEEQELISEEDIKAIAGGSKDGIAQCVFLSVCTAGISCAVLSGISAAVSEATECLGV